MNPIMQPIINKYVVLYVAHPFGGDLDNVSRADMKKTHEQQPLVKGQRRKTSISRILQRKRKDNGLQNFY